MSAIRMTDSQNHSQNHDGKPKRNSIFHEKRNGGHSQELSSIEKRKNLRGGELPNAVGSKFSGWNSVSAVEPFHQNRIVNVGVGNPDLIAEIDFFRVRPGNDARRCCARSCGMAGPHICTMAWHAANAAAVGRSRSNHPRSLGVGKWIAECAGVSTPGGRALAIPANLLENVYFQ